MRRAPILIAAALFCAPAAAHATSNLIVPGASIGPVTITSEAATLEDDPAIGRSRRISEIRHPGLGPNQATVIEYFWKVGISAEFPTAEASTVTSRITTRRGRYRTAAGIGLGSRRSAVRTAYPLAACDGLACDLIGYDLQFDGSAVRGSAIVTRFRFRQGRVVRVTIARIALGRLDTFVLHR